MKRFLLAKGKNEKAEEVMRKIASINQRDFIGYLIREENLELEKNLDGEDAVKLWPQLKRLYHSKLWYQTLSMSMWCFYLYLTYNATFFGLSELGGNLYINSMISALGELFAYIASCKRTFRINILN